MFIAYCGSIGIIAVNALNVNLVPHISQSVREREIFIKYLTTPEKR